MCGEPVALRPHHGMCLAYFVGEGYSQGFSAHMAKVLADLLPDTPVRLTVGTDVICAQCPNNGSGICDKPELVAGYDKAVLTLCGLSEGDVLPFGKFTALVQRHILSPGLRGRICGGCQWDALCARGKSRWEGGYL